MTMSSVEFGASFLAQMLLRGVLWLLLFLLVAPLFQHHSAARRALGWQMAFVGLILLPILLRCAPPLPLLHSDRPSTSGSTAPAIRWQSSPVLAPGTSEASHSFTGSSSLVEKASTVSPPPLIAITPPVQAADPGFMHVALPSLLILCWGLGAGWLFTRLMVGLVTLRRWGHSNVEAPEALRAEALEVAEMLGVRRPVTLRFAGKERELHAPVTWGLFRPTILLPREYAFQTKERGRAALLHELAHVRRRDWAWLVLAQSLCALYWCVPFVWIAVRRLSHETELACDDTVLSAGITAPDYAAQILEVVRNMQSEKSRLPFAAMPMARRPLAEARIRAILDTERLRRPNSRPALLLAAMLPILGVPILSLRVVAAQKSVPSAIAVTPSAGVIPAPSSAELNMDSIGTVPLTISKTESQPSLPSSSRSKREEAAPEATIVMQPAPPVAPRLAVAAPPEEELPVIVWGPIVNGLQAGLRLVGAKGVYTRGEPIWQEAYLRNNSANEVSIQTIGGYESQGAALITNAKGARVKVLRYFGMGLMWVKTTPVHPGEIAQVGRFAVAFLDAPRPHEVAPGLSFSAEESPLALAGAGAYMLAQELSPLDAAGKPLKKTVPTGAVPVRIGNGPSVEIRLTDHNHFTDLATAPIAWGPVHSGLQVGLFVLGSRSEFYIGERVRMAVVLRNVTKTPISFWHQTAFAFMETPQVSDVGGRSVNVTLAPETEWKTLSGIQMTGVTFDMTSAPSAHGPGSLRQSEIAPGQSILGYCLAAFVIPSRWRDGGPVPGRYHVVQPLRIGLGSEEQLDTTLETGARDITIYDPDHR
jgi:beta-lactamase regulating signal transducer with metallopeptidase domain